MTLISISYHKASPSWCPCFTIWSVTKGKNFQKKRYWKEQTVVETSPDTVRAAMRLVANYNSLFRFSVLLKCICLCLALLILLNRALLNTCHLMVEGRRLWFLSAHRNILFWEEQFCFLEGISGSKTAHFFSYKLYECTTSQHIFWGWLFCKLSYGMIRYF